MKHKGFTLIELLAVIVILAIIVLIAVPTITGIVEKSKKGGARESANGYNDAINKQMALNLMDSNDENDINKGIIDAPFDEKYNLKVKGQTPTKGWVFVNKDGTSVYSYVIGEYVVSYDGAEVTVVKGTEANSKPSFATDSWDTIAAYVRSGNEDIYNIGDEKKINMGKFGEQTVRIANKTKCDLPSQTACGFVVEFKTTMRPSFKYSEDGPTTDGWPASKLRDYVSNDMYNELPSDLKNVIVNTPVVSGVAGRYRKNGMQNFKSEDKLYLLSPKEVWGESVINDEYHHADIEAETRQLDYYKNNGVTIFNYSAAKKNWYWWLRGVNYYDTGFFYVGSRGEWVNGYAVVDYYDMAPAFRIG